MSATSGVFPSPVDQPLPNRDYEVLDSHIHLFPASHLSELAWQKSDGPLYAQYSVNEYRAARSPSGHRPCFVFIETDRKGDCASRDPKSSWLYPLKELEFLVRIAAGEPIVGEGHSPGDADLVAAIIPWAPLPMGREAMDEYYDHVKRRAGRFADKVVGFRYLLQDKPEETGWTDEFRESLVWMSDHAQVFELGIDLRGRGVWQAEVILSALVRNQICKDLVVVINHLAKPDISEDRYPSAPDKSRNCATAPTFEEWCSYMQLLASYPNMYVKLSGAFSQMAPLPSESEQTSMDPDQRRKMLEKCVSVIEPYFVHVARCFTPRRVIFGSDWPVCNINGGGQLAWQNWEYVVRTLVEKHLDEASCRDIIGENAKRIYRCG